MLVAIHDANCRAVTAAFYAFNIEVCRTGILVFAVVFTAGKEASVFHFLVTESNLPVAVKVNEFTPFNVMRSHIRASPVAREVIILASILRSMSLS